MLNTPSPFQVTKSLAKSSSPEVLACPTHGNASEHVTAKQRRRVLGIAETTVWVPWEQANSVVERLYRQ